jgi:hypothetical protein
MKFKELIVELHRNKPTTVSLVAAIKQNAEQLGHDITRSFITLQKIVGAHEAEIRARWSKMKSLQRRDVLLEAWPNMAEKHRPDLSMGNEIIITKMIGGRESLPPGPIYWPYINLEDLQQTQPLLLFLNARARNTPWTFALSELSFCPLAKAPSCLDCGEDEVHMKIIFCKDVEIGIYGEAVEVEKSVAKVYNINADFIDHCPRPSLDILRVQQRILKFLVNCSRAILHDKSFDQLMNSQMKAEPPALCPESEDNYTTFVDTVFLAPYRPRGILDFSRLRNYVLAALIIRRIMHGLCVRIHLTWPIPLLISPRMGLNGLKTHTETLIPLQSRWNTREVVSQIVDDAYTNLVFWDRLFKPLDDLSKQFDCGILRDKDLHEHFHTVVNISLHLRRMFADLSHVLRFYSWGAPEMRDWYFRQGEEIVTKISTRNSPEILAEIAHHLSYFDEKLSHHMDEAWFNTAIDRLDTLIKSSDMARKTISPTICGLLTKISIILECLRQMHIWVDTPQFNIFVKSHTNCTTDMTDLPLQEFHFWRKTVLSKVTIPLAYVSEKRLAYPAHKSRSKNNVQKMRAAEVNLDRLWSEIDSASAPVHPLVQCHLNGKMYRTSPWVSDADLGGAINEQNEEFVSICKFQHDESK